MLQVADDFLDIATPLKQLSEAALAPPGETSRGARTHTHTHTHTHTIPIHLCGTVCLSSLLSSAFRCVTPGTPNRDVNFADKSDKFDKHAAKLADTARLVASAGSTRNKRTVEAIVAAAQQVRTSGVRVHPL